jgi:hypothetical protein
MKAKARQIREQEKVVELYANIKGNRLARVMENKARKELLRLKKTAYRREIMLIPCYGCNETSTVLITVKLYTVYGPAHETKTGAEYVDQLLCPKCLQEEIS